MIPLLPDAKTSSVTVALLVFSTNFDQYCLFKTIFAEHLGNKCKNKVTKKLLEHFQYSYKELINNLVLKLTPQEKIEFEVTIFQIKKMLCGSSKQNGARFKHYVTRFDVNLLRNA